MNFEKHCIVAQMVWEYLSICNAKGNRRWAKVLVVTSAPYPPSGRPAHVPLASAPCAAPRKSVGSGSPLFCAFSLAIL